MANHILFIVISVTVLVFNFNYGIVGASSTVSSLEITDVEPTSFSSVEETESPFETDSTEAADPEAVTTAPEVSGHSETIDMRIQTGEECELQGHKGVCVILRECEPYLRLLQQQGSKPSQAVVELMRKAHCGFENKQPKVCCPAQQSSQRPSQVREGQQGQSNTQDPSDLVPSLPEAPVCGVSNASLGRVVGGVNATLGDFPWMAILGYMNRNTTYWRCGGSIISTKHILTAAHCIYSREKSLYVVRVGELDLAREDEGATPVDLLIKRRVIHEGYSPNSVENDIGVLILEREMQFTDLIKPICLPRSAELRANTFERYNPIVAGWGNLEFNGPAATLLQALQLPVVKNSACRESYKNFTKLAIDERVLCAGFSKGGKDSCSGDSGGPLMQPIWNVRTKVSFFHQIGIVSVGKNCALAGFPGIYSRVTAFIPWIEKTVLAPTTA